MGNLSKIGRIFYGIAIGGMGFNTLYYDAFPYMLLPPQENQVPHLVTYISGALLIFIGTSIVFNKKTRSIALSLGWVLLLIFCFYYIPYQFMVNPNYMHLAEWENAEKELTLAGGALVIAGCFSEKNKKSLNQLSGRLIRYGAILFSIPIISFGILHFLYAKEASTLVPSWIPYPICWTYFAGVALLGSGIAIILKIRIGPIAALLGTMILIWFIILHIPRVIAAAVADRVDELTSAWIALAYSGIAFVISGDNKKKVNLSNNPMD